MQKEVSSLVVPASDLCSQRSPTRQLAWSSLTRRRRAFGSPGSPETNTTAPLRVGMIWNGGFCLQQNLNLCIATNEPCATTAKYNTGLSYNWIKMFVPNKLPPLISLILPRVSNPVRGSPPPAWGLGEFDGGRRCRDHGTAKPLPVCLLLLQSPGSESDWLQRTQPGLEPVQDQPCRWEAFLKNYTV